MSASRGVGAISKPHPGGQAAYPVRVRFSDQRQSVCRSKVEITAIVAI
jgi:hypothetical protein